MKFPCFLLISLSCFLGTSTYAMDLKEAYALAFKNDPVFQNAAAVRLSQGETYPQAKAALLPNLSATANTTGYQILDEPLFPTQRFNSNGYSINLSETLINITSWATLGQASATVKSAEATYQAAIQNLIFRTASAYFNVLFAQDSLQYTHTQAAALRHQLVVAKSRFKAGLDANTSMYNAQASYDSVRSQEIVARNTLTTNQEALGHIIGFIPPSLAPLNHHFKLVTPQPANIQRWITAATDHNFTLLAARYAMEAARKNILVNEGGQFPSLNAVASFTRTNGDPAFYGLVNERVGTVGLQVNIPIYEGGLISSQTRQAEDNYAQAMAVNEGSYRDTLVATRQGYKNIEADIREIYANQHAVTSAEKSLQSTDQAYKLGTRSIFDIIQAQQALFQAQSTLAQSQYNYILDTLQFKQAVGTLSANDVLTINQWLSEKRSAIP